MYAENQEPKPVRLYARRFYMVTLYDQKQTWGKWENLETTTAKILPGDEAREVRDHYPRWPDMSPNAWAGATLYAGPVYQVTSIAQNRVRRVDWVRTEAEIEALRRENAQDRVSTRRFLVEWGQGYAQLNYEKLAADYAECVRYLDNTPAESDPMWRVEVEKVQ